MPETMRAVVIARRGGPEVLELRDVPKPKPGTGEIRVRVRSSGINRADLLQRKGGYPAPQGWPSDIPGLEYAGTVDAVGSGDERWRAGDAVMGILGGGGYAEHVVVPAETVVSAPSGMDLTEAGALPEAFMTAWDAAFVQEGLSAGETLLVHAVGSGVGTAALQLGRAFGARVIGTSRTRAKLDRAADLGLEHALLADETWPDRVLKLTEGRGADVILDLVGGRYLAGNQRAVASRGRHIIVGVPGGAKAELDFRALMRKGSSLRGTLLRPRSTAERAVLARSFSDNVLPRIESGEILPVIDEVFDAAEVAEAHRRMEANESFGKLLLGW